MDGNVVEVGRSLCADLRCPALSLGSSLGTAGSALDSPLTPLWWAT